MDLFQQIEEQPIRVISEDGIVDYYGILYGLDNADQYFNYLFNEIEWQKDQAIIFGKLIETKRKVAWYGDKPFNYTYSKTTKQALPWTKPLLQLKAEVERTTNETYNSCLLNLYHNGSEGMAWHSDAEKDLKRDGAVASLSFGAERKFSFKHKKSKRTESLILRNGSLLVMKGKTQTHWMHRLPPTKTTDQPRINLTFRSILDSQLAGQRN